LVLSRHLNAPDGKFQGGVLGVIEIERTQRWFESLNIDQHDTVALIDNSQVLLARRPFLQTHLEKKLPASFFLKNLHENAVTSGMVIARDIDGLERLFGYYKIEDFPFFIVVGFEKKIILQQWYKRAIELSVGFAMILLLAWFVVRSHIVTLRQHKALSTSNALLRSSEANFRMLAENMADIVWRTDAQLVVNYINPADQRIRGFASSEVIGASIQNQYTNLGKEILKAESEKRLALERSGTKGIAMKYELPMLHKNGGEIWVDIASVPIYGSDGEINGYQSVARDISERRQHDAKLLQEHSDMENRLQAVVQEKSVLQELATLDPLTGLYNRRFLDDAIMREISRSEREEKQFAVIMLDLDHFKNVNDQYGHAAGDEVLKTLAMLMKKASRESDLICRFGGEEFVAIMPNMSAIQARDRVETWRRQLEETTVIYGDSRIQITLSAGIAIFPLHGRSGEELITRADEMLYRSKQQGRNRISVMGLEG
jgi:diguanylate cyclase (GGDEF)-like protein/PAS domain S-box-containing protein